MKNVSDQLFLSYIISIIAGIPLVLGIIILVAPLIIIAGTMHINPTILIKTMFVFAVAFYLVKFFSKYQFIENGIVGLGIGTLMLMKFNWSPLLSIIIGMSIFAALFLLLKFNTFFWIKTILFSLIITTGIYLVLYSSRGISPVENKVWKICVFVIFLIENIYVRCCTWVDNFDNMEEGRNENIKSQHIFTNEKMYEKENHDNRGDNHAHTDGEDAQKLNWFSGTKNKDELKKRYHDLQKIYHPDNQAGDITVSQQIQEEYNLLCKRYENSNSI